MTAKSELRRGRESRIDARELSRLRAALLAERSALERLAAENQATIAELTGQSDVDSILERELADASIDRTEAAIGDIDAALARLDAGTYGVCESCGGAIPIERLDVIPHARTCVTCPSQGRTFGL
jgi:RNA polymerase-binding transcription factor DksA